MTKKSKSAKPGYDVGYGKPPAQTQFKPGQSGNPKGRPKGQPGFNELLLREAGRLVKVETPSGVKSFTRAEVVIRKLFNAAGAGDLNASRLIMSYLARTLISQETAEAIPDAGSFKIPDEEAISRIMARFQHVMAEKESGE